MKGGYFHGFQVVWWIEYLGKLGFDIATRGCHYPGIKNFQNILIIIFF